MNLGERMKEYEKVSKSFLIRRVPVIIRLDGKAFHTFTRGIKRPFDRVLSKTMQDTMKYLCSNVQGCVLGYTQSDEITLVLTDWQNRDTSAWFDNNIQKMTSISASMATLSFNKFFVENSGGEYQDKYNNALFDSRCLTSQKRKSQTVWFGDNKMQLETLF